MREMSADVEQSGVVVAAAAVGASAPAVAAAPAAPPVAVHVASENVGAGEAKGQAVSPPKRAGLAIGGYVVLILGTLLAIILPRVGMKAGLLEDALVILSIMAMIAGTGMVMFSFVWNLLRQM
jgi:hypothetical protein